MASSKTSMEEIRRGGAAGASRGWLDCVSDLTGGHSEGNRDRADHTGGRLRGSRLNDRSCTPDPSRRAPGRYIGRSVERGGPSSPPRTSTK